MSLKRGDRVKIVHATDTTNLYGISRDQYKEIQDMVFTIVSVSKYKEKWYSMKGIKYVFHEKLIAEPDVIFPDELFRL